MEEKSTKIPSIESFYDLISEEMDKRLDLGIEEQRIYFETDQLYFECKVRIYSEWKEYGDGYWEPYETICVKAEGIVDEVIATFRDEEGEEIEIPDEDYADLEDFVQFDLNRFCENRY